MATPHSSLPPQSSPPRIARSTPTRDQTSCLALPPHPIAAYPKHPALTTTNSRRRSRQAPLHRNNPPPNPPSSSKTTPPPIRSRTHPPRPAQTPYLDAGERRLGDGQSREGMRATSSGRMGKNRRHRMTTKEARFDPSDLQNATVQRCSSAEGYHVAQEASQ